MWFETRELSLDLDKISKIATVLESALAKNCEQIEPDKYGGSVTTASFEHYNLATMCNEELHALYTALQAVFRERVPDGTYYLQSWVNIHRKNQHLDWHEHWGSESFHGYFCVNAEPSTTSYKNPQTKQVDSVTNRNNTLTLNAGGWLHRVSPWRSDRPRISIAYDIVPVNLVISQGKGNIPLNHWMPI